MRNIDIFFYFNQYPIFWGGGNMMKERLKSTYIQDTIYLKKKKKMK